MPDLPLTKQEALETLRRLSGYRVWLAGGIAADFHVGRWTRDHDDVDLVAFEEDREVLEGELSASGFAKTGDDVWITRWTRSGRVIGEVSLAFMRRSGPTTGDLVITPEGSRDGSVRTGLYPGVEGNLDATRHRTLEGVTFRVVSAEDEWSFTHGFHVMHPGAKPGETDRHNVALLESVLAPEDIERLRPLAGRRLPLPDGADATPKEDVDAEK